MKFLFLCRGNVGRSQIAAAFFNKITNTNDAGSAGLKVFEKEGQKLGDLKGSGKLVIDVMKEEEIDISQNTRRQVTQEMMDAADKIVVLAEPEVIDNNLRANSKAIFWNVEDPLNTSIERHREIRDHIKRQVEKFIQEIGFL